MSWKRLALHLSAAPLQAITPSYLSKLLPELQAPISATIAAISQATTTANTTATTGNNQEAVTSATTALSNDEDCLDNLMRKFNNNREEVARHLGISRTTLWRRLSSQKTFAKKKQ